MPTLVIFGGPNGAGKSSIIRHVDFGSRDHLLEADAIASRMDASDPRRAAIEAGREVLRRAQEYLDRGEDFAIETTLSGSWTTGVVKKALARRFLVRLVYVNVEDAEQSIRRVHERVVQGGHNVPDDDVRRRYARSLSNLKQLVNVVDETIIYDNSGSEPRLILEIRSGVVSKAGELPDWARDFETAMCGAEP